MGTAFFIKWCSSQKERCINNVSSPGEVRPLRCNCYLGDWKACKMTKIPLQRESNEDGPDEGEAVERTKSKKKMSEGRRRGRTVKNETDCGYSSRYPEWQAWNEGSIKAPLQGQSKEKVSRPFLLSLLSCSANSSVSIFILDCHRHLSQTLLCLKAEAKLRVISHHLSNPCSLLTFWE